MRIVCMAVASRKMHRGFSFERHCPETVLVFVVMLAGCLIDEVRSYWQAGLPVAEEDVEAWTEGLSLQAGSMLAVSAAWLLNGLPAWVDRSPWVPLAVVLTAFVLCVVGLDGALSFGGGILGVALLGLVLTLVSRMPASCVQWVCQSIEKAVCGDAKEPADRHSADELAESASRKHGLHEVGESGNSRPRVARRATSLPALFLLCGASAVAVVLFVALAGVAVFGWSLRALAFDVVLGVLSLVLHSVFLLLVCEAWYVDQRARGALCTAVLWMVALPASFVAIGAVQGSRPSERVLVDGALRTELPLFLGGMQVAFAQPVGALFGIPLESYQEPLPANESLAEEEVDEEARDVRSAAKRQLVSHVEAHRRCRRRSTCHRARSDRTNRRHRAGEPDWGRLWIREAC